MHRVLQIPEILLNIFCQCGLSCVPNTEDRQSTNRDLAALARTCRAFKEPALDMLWSELQDASPLSRCLPGISHHVITRDGVYSKKLYSFTRPLERAEWDILCSYGRRVWYIYNPQTLDWKSLGTSLDFTPPDPLFPNLRSLHCDCVKETIPLLQMPLPSLARLNIRLPFEADQRILQDPLRSLAKTSPNIKWLIIRTVDHELESSKIISDGICGWSNLQLVTCPHIPLNVDALVHLSRMPMLSRLTLTLSSTFLAHDIPSESHSFTTLDYLSLHAGSLSHVSRLLSWTCLPSIMEFTVTIDSCPSKEDLAHFMASLEKAGISDAVEEMNLEQVHDDPDTDPLRGPDTPLLDLDDLRLPMAFPNLRRMNLNLEWDVGLSDEGLLALASAWPQLDTLLININRGWNRPSGITPDGLASLLQTHPSLSFVALAIDTRGFTQLPTGRYEGPLNMSLSTRPFHLDVVDSVIEEESVDAMVAFLSSVVSRPALIIGAWETWSVANHPDSDLYRERWGNVESLTNKAIELQ